MHIRCSGLARPMICAGYVHLDLPKSPSNDKAEEGTAAGEYLERLLTGRPLGEVASNGRYFDSDMKFYLDPIREDVMSRTSATDILCEQRIDWETSSGIWIKGQYDIAFVDENDTLCIEDLKYGYGIVEVEENWQLIAYAIGECIRRGKAFDKISMKIHQPRPHHEDGVTREWLISYNDLLEYKEKIENRMQEIADGEKTLVTSKHCKYCMGTGEACPAFSRLFYRGLEVSTEFFQDSIDDEELARQLDETKRAEDVIKIKKDSLIELGVLRIAKGKIIPGYMQEKAYGNRTWKKGISPEAIEIMTGKNVVKKTFMSPAQAEKLGISRQLTDKLTEKYFIKNKLVKKSGTKTGNKIFGTTSPKGN